MLSLLRSILEQLWFPTLAQLFFSRLVPTTFEVPLFLQGLLILIMPLPDLDEFYVWLECDDEEMEEYDLQTLSSGVKSCWVASEPGKVRNRRNTLVRSACIMIIFIKFSPSLSW